jgi:hypothetical protein
MRKDFKCPDIFTGHLYISRDLVLDEKVFPFASLGSSAGALYTSEVLLLPEPQSGNNTSTNADDSPARFPLPVFRSCVQQPEDNTASRLAPWAPADTCPAHSLAPDVPSAPRQERASADMRPHIFCLVCPPHQARRRTILLRPLSSRLPSSPLLCCF